MRRNETFPRVPQESRSSLHSLSTSPPLAHQALGAQKFSNPESNPRRWAKGGHSAPQVHLFKALVLLFLPLDVIAYHLCVPSYCGYKVSPRPEVLTYEVPLLLAVYASQVYRTLSLDKPDHLRHCVFWWDRN